MNMLKLVDNYDVAIDSTTPLNFTNWEIVEVESRRGGQRGLFAKTNIESGSLIGCFGGHCVSYDRAALSAKGREELLPGSVIQIFCDERRILGLVDTRKYSGIDFINHSCMPNVIVRNRIVLIASQRILAGQELTTDYRLWSFAPEGISCWCSPSRCRI
jgi:hypothetical protein